MIRWSHIRTVFHKEFLDTIRDKKTLLMNLGLPIVVWPVLAVFITEFAASQIAKQDERVSRIALVGEPLEAIDQAIATTPKLTLVQLPETLSWDFSQAPGAKPAQPTDSKLGLAAKPKSPGEQQVERLIKEDLVDAVLYSASTFDGPFRNRVFRVLSDHTEPHSIIASKRVSRLLADLGEDVLQERLQQLGLPRSRIQPWEMQSGDVAPMQKAIATVAGRVMPLLLIVLIVLSGFYPAIIMTAGEKEHGTLPTLLCAPINHLELMFGKYLAILTQALTGVFTNLLSIMAVAQLGLGDLPISPSPWLFVAAFVALIPVAMLYTAMFMTVAIFANSFREGQNLLSPFTVVAIVPAYAAILPGIELTPLTAITPGLNIALLVKQLMLQDLTPTLASLTLLSNIFWTTLVLAFTARLFASEQVLLAGRKGIADVLTTNRDAVPEPDQRIAWMYYCFLLVTTVYLSASLARVHLALYMVVAQVGGYFLISCGIVRYFRMSAVRVFRLRPPRPLALLGAVLVGGSLFLPNIWLAQLTPMPETFQKAMMDALGLSNANHSIWVLLLLIAFIPALCEEFAFRGLIFSGLRKDLKPAPAILLTGFLFALAHFSQFRMLPLFVTGVILTYAAWRSGSIWTGFIIHLMNNAIAVVLVRQGEWVKQHTGMGDDFQAPLSWILVALAITLIGLALIHLGRRQER